MGIDGIGKPPGAGIPPQGLDRAGPADPAREAFKVEKPGAAKDAAPVAGPAPSDALGRLERGEINVDQYLDQRVTEAVEHLSGKLGPEQLEFVKDTLRDQLKTDPVLMELVRRSVGNLPTEG
jgi:hypothetical protein